MQGMQVPAQLQRRRRRQRLRQPRAEQHCRWWYYEQPAVRLEREPVPVQVPPPPVSPALRAPVCVPACARASAH